MKNTQKGRSMVEMLGVLAIIGVLSVGGIAGYTAAMNRYRANQILDMASKTAVIAQTLKSGAGGTACTKTSADAACDAKDGINTGMVWTLLAGVSSFEATAANDSSQVVVELDSKPTGGVPEAMTSIVGGGVSYDGDTTITITTN